MRKLLKVVVTGDVDSGKSTLIGRFLYEAGSLSGAVIKEIENVCERINCDFEFAYLLDSFEEERRQQLTIETTQACCKTKSGREFIFIDVPGHQELLKSMLCGSSDADLAILVIDMQKSIKEQTKRHAFILNFLGIEKMVIALNKMDTSDYKENIFKKIKDEVAAVLNKMQLEPKYFIPVSAKQGDNLIRASQNMPWYKGLSVLEVLNSLVVKERAGSFRLPIQDIYDLNGEKIAVGRISSGQVKKGDRIKVLPAGKECRVKKIKVFNINKSKAQAPESIGLVLDDMDELQRGQIICQAELPLVKTEFLAKIFCVNPLNIRGNLRLCCATQEVLAQIKKVKGIWDTASLEPKHISGNTLRENDAVEVIITTREPLVVEVFKEANSLGRFVLKSDKEISAIGIIL